MHTRLAAISIFIVLILGFVDQVSARSPEQWYREGQLTVELSALLQPNKQRAKNVVLFVGDGMGVSTVTAARILDGQLRGGHGEENRLNFETLPYVALSKTYNTNQQTPDSAGTMTAMMTGVKSKAGVIAVNQLSIRGNCASALKNKLPTFLEEAEREGKSTGMVTTARLTHATPAATYAHIPERNWEDDDNLTDEAVQNGCKDIALQFVEFPFGDGIDVALGGGRRGFWPKAEADPEDSDKSGARKDGRNLTKEWLRRHENSAFVWNKNQFDRVDTRNISHLLGLFDLSHMAYEADRARDIGGEPSLSEMTRKAIEILSRNAKGFFLMVESGRIDHAHHAGNAYRALTDTIEFANAVKVARELTNSTDTLVIVTADHSHVLTISGYPTRGNPILGKVVGNDTRGNPETSPKRAADGKPYTTLGYQNGPGFAFLEPGGEPDSRRPLVPGRVVDLSLVDTEDDGFYQESLVPSRAETHGGEDVAIYAGGPGAYLLHGIMEQNVIYHVMRRASGIARIKNID